LHACRSTLEDPTSPHPLKYIGHKMVTTFRTPSSATYRKSSAFSVRGNSLYDNMGDTGREPVTPCLSLPDSSFRRGASERSYSVF